MKARLTLEDTAGQKTSMHLNGLAPAMATPGPALLAFASSIQPYFNGLISEYYASIPDEQVLSIPAQDVPYQSSLHKGLVTLGFALGDETRYRGVWIPAPNLLQYEIVSGVGYRMSAASGAAFLAAINTVSDTTHTFRQGVLEYREGRQAKPGEGGYLEMSDFNGRKAYMKVPDVSDKALLASFANTLGTAVTGYTTCGISKAVIMTLAGGVRGGAPTDETGYDSVGGRCKLRFSYPVGDKLAYFTLNAPTLKAAHIESGAGSDAKKRLVKQAAGDAIAAELTTLYGAGVRTVTFDTGYFDQDNIGR